MTIYISNQQDMQTVAMILFKNGYTVRKEKVLDPATGKKVLCLAAEKN